MVETPVLKRDDRPFLEIQKENFDKAVELIEKSVRTFSKGDLEYAVFFARRYEDIEMVRIGGAFVSSDKLCLIDLNSGENANYQNWVAKSLWKEPGYNFKLPVGTDWSKFSRDFVAPPGASVYQGVEAFISALKAEVAKAK